MRLLPDWITAFEEYAVDLPSPKIYLRWCAIACIAGALERKVWIRSLKQELYPNLYTVLVGPPGVGKTQATSQVEMFWRGLKDHKVAPTALTRASLIDALDEAKRTKTVIGASSLHLEFNSLLVNAGELGVLIPAYDSDFMNNLTAIYDGFHYEERKRGNDLHIVIKRPQINLLAATTPAYLNSMLPEGAWDQGFLSRTFLIYAGEKIVQDIFADEAPKLDLLDKLKLDLREISELAGQIGIDPDARDAISQWHMAGGPPAPEHPKLVHYLTRRTAHLLKLATIASVSRTSELVISMEDYQTALGWLLTMEHSLTDIFKALGSKGDSQLIEEAYHYLYQVYMANKDAVAEHRLVGFLAERAPAHAVLRIMEIMIKSGQIQQQLTKAGTIGYVPLGRVVH